MIIGVTGTFSSGKDTVAQFFIERGFPHYSTADELRRLATAKGVSHDRASIQKFAAEQRRLIGPDFLERLMMPNIHGDALLTAMRHPVSIDYLRSLGHFYLIAVDAPLDIRFERALARGRVGDGTTLEQFGAQENVEREGGAWRLDEVVNMADYVIMNEGSLEELEGQVEAIYEEILHKEGRGSGQTS